LEQIEDNTDKLVLADRPKLRLPASLLGSFLIGGIIGALGFKSIGFLAVVPLVILLLLLAGLPMAEDLITKRHGLHHPNQRFDAEPIAAAKVGGSGLTAT
jgi:hypothetical protein